MSKSSKSRLYTALGWAVFTIAKRSLKKKLAKATHVEPSGGKGKKLLTAGAVAAVVGGAAYAANSANSGTGGAA